MLYIRFGRKPIGTDSSPLSRRDATLHLARSEQTEPATWRFHDTMGEMSRKPSSQPVLNADDTSSLTSFPDPAAPSPPDQTPSQGLNGLLDRSGPTIFDEQHSETASDAHTLSSAPTEVLQSVIDHQGAVFLVRRLAKLLAERDAHITALTRLAEEYRIPAESVSATASRVKQAEQRRLALVTAADEALAAPADAARRAVCSRRGISIKVKTDDVRRNQTLRPAQSRRGRRTAALSRVLRDSLGAVAVGLSGVEKVPKGRSLRVET